MRPQRNNNRDSWNGTANKNHCPKNPIDGNQAHKLLSKVKIEPSKKYSNGKVDSKGVSISADDLKKSKSSIIEFLESPAYQRNND